MIHRQQYPQYPIKIVKSGKDLENHQNNLGDLILRGAYFLSLKFYYYI